MFLARRPSSERIDRFLRESQDLPYRIRVMSWPQGTLARVGQPIVRVLQARFRRHSAAAMKRAIGKPTVCH
jgi:hypothetical protein